MNLTNERIDVATTIKQLVPTTAGAAVVYFVLWAILPGVAAEAAILTGSAAGAGALLNARDQKRRMIERLRMLRNAAVDAGRGMKSNTK